MQVRDQLTNAVVEDIPESQVGIEYQLALKESRGELGKEFDGNEDEGNDQLNRLSRTTPYYKVCSPPSPNLAVNPTISAATFNGYSMRPDSIRFFTRYHHTF